MAEFVEDQAKPPQHTDEYKRGVYACGERRDHIIRVHRSKWPPRSMQGLNPAMVLEQPHLRGTCERCGANLIVYDPPDAQVKVVLYGEAGEAHGRVEDEHGEVVEETSIPEAGQVIDEPEPTRRKGR